MTCETTTQQLPGVWNPIFYQGTNFTNTLTVIQNGTAWDFTDYTGEMKLVNSSKDVVLTISTDNEYIASMSSTGVITFNIPAEVVGALKEGTYQYDLLVTSPDETPVTYPIVAGNAVVIYSPTGSE